ncbi:MAG: hypothetical protein AAFO63_13830 [Pseudomonadota bacterium]
MIVDPTDIAILLVSGAACVYCFVLNRRLKALQDTKNGLGATIMALTKSIADMSAKTKQTRVQADDIATRLTQSMLEAEAARLKLQEMTDMMQSSHTEATAEVRAAQVELSTMMRDVVAQSRDRIMEMTMLMREMRALSEQVHPDPDQNQDQGAELESVLFASSGQRSG